MAEALARGSQSKNTACLSLASRQMNESSALGASVEHHRAVAAQDGGHELIAELARVTLDHQFWSRSNTMSFGVAPSRAASRLA
jgi:hypothetical protein